MLSAKGARKIANIRRTTRCDLMNFILKEIYKASDSLQYSYTWYDYSDFNGYLNVLNALESLGYKIYENTERQFVMIDWS